MLSVCADAIAINCWCCCETNHLVAVVSRYSAVSFSEIIAVVDSLDNGFEGGLNKKRGRNSQRSRSQLLLVSRHSSSSSREAVAVTTSYLSCEEQATKHTSFRLCIMR